MKSILTIASILLLSLGNTVLAAEYDISGDLNQDKSTQSTSTVTVTNGESQVDVSIEGSVLGLLIQYFAL